MTTKRKVSWIAIFKPVSGQGLSMTQLACNGAHEIINHVVGEYGNVAFHYVGKGRFGDNELENMMVLDEHIRDGDMPDNVSASAGRQAGSEDGVGDDAVTDYSSF